jgi:hypothetical protein
MPSPPSNVFLPKNGGSNSMRSTVSLGYPAAFEAGTIVCLDSTGVIRPYSYSHPNNPIFGIVEQVHLPMRTEIDVVHGGIINLEWIESGKTYYLQHDGSLAETGEIPLLQGCRKGEGIFVRPSLISESKIPTGTMMKFCGRNPPEGWLLCDGSLISQRKYPRLHSVLMEDIKPLTLKIASNNDQILVLVHEGKIEAGTKLLFSALGWKGKILVLSSVNGLVTASIDDKSTPYIPLSAGSTCQLLPSCMDEVFLPCKSDVDFRWIVKT